MPPIREKVKVIFWKKKRKAMQSEFWEQLSERIRSVSASALASGKLCPLSTTCTAIPQPIGEGVACPAPFVVRVLQPRANKGKDSNGKDKGKKPEGDIQALPESTLEDAKRRSPFLHPDPDLLVGSLSAHNIILNKYPVTSHHILLCTKEFHTQEEHLTPADLSALECCARHAYPSTGALCFYNCGLVSGASQGHKHVQIVPAIISEPGFPAQRYFLDAIADALPASARTVPGLGFRHAFRKFAEDECGWEKAYSDLLAQAGVPTTEDGKAAQSYNLVCTHRWMFVVPRSCESAVVPRVDGSSHEMSVNSLGFAGSFLVKDPMDVEAIRKITPLEILSAITFKN